MAIEIPNYVHAAAWVIPTFAADFPEEPSPFFMNEGWQQYDPTTTAADPVGGFTDLLPGFGGLYAMKLQQGIDTLESIIQCSMLEADKQGSAVMIPLLPDFILGDSLADGFTALVSQLKVTDPEGLGQSPFAITVWRASQTRITEDQFGGLPVG